MPAARQLDRQPSQHTGQPLCPRLGSCTGRHLAGQLTMQAADKAGSSQGRWDLRRASRPGAVAWWWTVGRASRLPWPPTPARPSTAAAAPVLVCRTSCTSCESQLSGTAGLGSYTRIEPRRRRADGDKLRDDDGVGRLVKGTSVGRLSVPGQKSLRGGDREPPSLPKPQELRSRRYRHGHESRAARRLVQTTASPLSGHYRCPGRHDVLGVPRPSQWRAAGTCLTSSSPTTLAANRREPPHRSFASMDSSRTRQASRRFAAACRNP